MKSGVDNCVPRCLSMLNPPAGVFILAATRRSGDGVGANPPLLAGARTGAGSRARDPESTPQSAPSCWFGGDAGPGARRLSIQRVICIVNIFKQAGEEVEGINDNNICGNEISGNAFAAPPKRFVFVTQATCEQRPFLCSYLGKIRDAITIPRADPSCWSNLSSSLYP